MNLLETIRSHGYVDPLHHPEHDNTVCMDFDGVLCKSAGPYTRNHFGPPEPEGLKLLRLLQGKGFQVVILTARKETDCVANWLAGRGFPGLMVTNHKVPAIAYVDDRAVHAGKGFSALQLMREIEKRHR